MSHIVLNSGIAVMFVFCSVTAAEAQHDPKLQSPSEIDKQTAKMLVDEGITEQNAQHYDKAIDLYKRAFSLVSHPALLFNIGQAHRLVGRPERAIPFYERYLALSPDGPESAVAREFVASFYLDLGLAEIKLGREVQAQENLTRALRYGDEPLGVALAEKARGQLREVESHLGRLDVTCPTEDAEVMLDGVALFTGPGRYRGWVKAKDHELTVKKPGYQLEVKRLTIASGEFQHIEMRLRAPGVASVGSRRWAVWKPWAVVASGVVLTATSGALHALAYRNFNTYDTKFVQLPCESSGGCTPAGVPSSLNDQLSLARRQQSLAVTGYVAGGSLIAAGVVFVYLNRPNRTEHLSRSVRTESTTITPVVSHDMLGILMNLYY